LTAPKVSKTRFEKLYRFENDANVKERMLLVLNVVYEKQIPAQVARDLHRSRTWASDWLKRYRKEEGIEGLKNRTKSGRPPDIPEETVYEIKKELASSKQGWTTKQVEDLIVRKSGGTRYQIPLYTYLQTHAQLGIQTESITKSTCKYCI
jgi:transposase